MRFSLLIALALTSATAGVSNAQTNHASNWIQTIRSIGPQGRGNSEAARAWSQLSQLEASQLPTILAGMDGANPLAINWLRAAVDAIASRTLAQSKPLPVAALETFLNDTRHEPRARVTAYEWITRVDQQAKQRLIPQRLDDPSMELRHLAIEMGLSRAAKLRDADSKEAAKTAYARLFRSTRDLSQAKAVAGELEKLGEKPDLASHFGFIMRWRLIGPFDNRDKKGFDVPYGPEADPSLTSYAGKEGEVKWIDHTTDDSLGMVDLNQALGRHKGAICYAYAEFISAEPRECQIRIGCVNANKVWLNGELLTANHVYHSGRSMDQYQGAGQLRKGVNQILIKVCQNEQEEQWAQDWEFQLRVCDALGGGLLSTDRPAPKAAFQPTVRRYFVAK